MQVQWHAFFALVLWAAPDHCLRLLRLWPDRGTPEPAEHHVPSLQALLMVLIGLPLPLTGQPLVGNHHQSWSCPLHQHHVSKMQDSRLPKVMMFGQVKGPRCVG